MIMINPLVSICVRLEYALQGNALQMCLLSDELLISRVQLFVDAPLSQYATPVDAITHLMNIR